MDLHNSLLTVERARQALADALAKGDRDDVAAPIRAGMRARALADACEELKLAAILIDATGRVLHVGSTAAGLLGNSFDVVSGHLVGRTRGANRAVQRAVMMALGTLTGEPADEVAGVVGVPFRDDSPFQVLRGILILRPSEPAAVSSLRAALAA